MVHTEPWALKGLKSFILLFHVIHYMFRLYRLMIGCRILINQIYLDCIYKSAYNVDEGISWAGCDVICGVSGVKYGIVCQSTVNIRCSRPGYNRQNLAVCSREYLEMPRH
jgi:hypothetical protein